MIFACFMAASMVGSASSTLLMKRYKVRQAWMCCSVGCTVPPASVLGSMAEVTEGRGVRAGFAFPPCMINVRVTVDVDGLTWVDVDG
jgi:hypothetical protein